MAKTAKTLSDISKENINKGIRDIATRSTWMLGVLVLIIIGLASFIFKDSNAELQIGSFYWVMWVTAGVSCLFYLALLLIYIQSLIVPNFKDYTDESNPDRLRDLINTFKSLIFLFVISVPSSFIFALGLWAAAALTS